MRGISFGFLGFVAIVNVACGGSDAPAAPAGSAGQASSAGRGGSAGSPAGAPGTGGASTIVGDGGAGATGSGTAQGTVMGVAFSKVVSAWWIGKPATGSAPTQIYVSDASLACADLAAAGWDHLLGTNQLMEFDLAGSAPKTYAIGTDADASYVNGNYNPSAEAGSITVTTTNTDKNIVGTYDLTFAGDNVKGTFDAAYCADGVEP